MTVKKIEQPLSPIRTAMIELNNIIPAKLKDDEKVNDAINYCFAKILEAELILLNCVDHEALDKFLKEKIQEEE